MAITTALTELLEIRHPILLAPMDLIATGELAAAVSAAGGLGIIGGGYGEADWIDAQFEAAGNQPVGVGFITWALAEQPELLDQALERAPRAVALSFGNPAPFAPKIKAAGAKLICQIQTLAHARSAVEAGADVLIAQGAEAGGHGMTRGGLSLVPAVVDAVGAVPVVSGGGHADGRGLAAALMLGAAGILMGSRFMVSQESGADAQRIEQILEASADDTLRTSVVDRTKGVPWSPSYTGRVLATDFVRQWHGHLDDLDQAIAAERPRYLAAVEDNDFTVASFPLGEGADLIHDVPSAAEIVERVVGEAETQLARVSSLVQGS